MSSALYKEKMKLYHDKKIDKIVFEPSDMVLLYDSRVFFIPGKLNSRLYGPFTMHRVFSHDSIELK